jgi:hypothetical protein
MEESSQDEDPDEALKRYYAKMKEKRKKPDEKRRCSPGHGITPVIP